MRGDKRKLNKKTIKKYIICILIPVLTGIFSVLLTGGPMKLYAELHKPFFAPPAILFPIVWTILYILMGIGSGNIMLSNARSREKAPAYLWYLLQLVLNFCWPILFFHFKAFKLSFVWIALLWYAVFRMILAFFKVDKHAAALQIPYLLWVTFATLLNLTIAILN